VSVTPLVVQMHAYDALGNLGGKGTTILIGDFAHLPSFLLPSWLQPSPGYAPPTGSKGVASAPPPSDPTTKNGAVPAELTRPDPDGDSPKSRGPSKQ
jgi:hypothetical protein